MAAEVKQAHYAVRDDDLQLITPPQASDDCEGKDTDQSSSHPSPVEEREAMLDGGASDDATAAEVDSLERREPRDRYHLVYIIMVIHGIGTLMPWNMFITPKSYFEDYKLNQTREDMSEYRTNFISYLGMVAQIPCVLMHFLNLCCHCGGKSGVRIVVSIIIIVVVFIVTLILAMVDSSEWPESFFWITMASAFISNSAGGVYLNSLYGVVVALPMKYTNAIIFGNNFCGTFVSVLNIVMIAVAPNARSFASYFFLGAVVVLLIALDTYFVLPHTAFFRHYTKQIEREAPPTENGDSVKQRLLSYWLVFKQIWHLAVSVWFVFFVSLALFPQIQSDIRPKTMSFSEVYWTPVFGFLSFNLFTMLGNLLTEIIHFPGPRWVWIPVLARAVFIPLYLMFNFRPDTRSWPAYLANDGAFLFCSVLMAWSGGYFSSLCMMYAPRQVAKNQAGTAGMMMAFFMVLGIVCGVYSSRLLVLCVE